MNLFLIGYRCTGKTTVAKSLAANLDWSFVDADTMLVTKCGQQIEDIVDTEGWEAFRRRERSTLRQICKKKQQVVATGGGVVLDADNVKAMRASGIVIGLGATAETIRQRMLQDEKTRAFRPALTDKGPLAEIEDILKARGPYYERASDFFIHTDEVPVDEITQKIIELLNERSATSFKGE